MSETMNNEEGKPDSLDNTPVVIGKKTGKFGVGGVGSWVVVGLVLLIVLAVLIVRSQDKEEDVLSFAPADSFFAVEVEDLNGAAEVFATLPLWKDKGFSKDGITKEFISWFGSDEQIFSKFIGVIKSFTYIESFVNRKPETILVLRAGNTWDIESYFRREYSTVATPVKVADDMTGLEITRKDKSIFYLKKVANFVLITDSKALLKRALNAYTNNELSLASCNIRFGDGNGGVPRFRMYAAINSYFINYPQDRAILPPKVYNMIAGDSAFLYEATINNTGFVAQGRIIKSIAAAYATGDDAVKHSQRGFFGTVLWVFFVILVVVIALPVLFVLVTLLLALYFFLIAWWKGELVGIDPPLAEISREMKDDLATGKKVKNSAGKEGKVTGGVKDEPVVSTGSAHTGQEADSVSKNTAKGDVSGNSEGEETEGNGTGK